MLLLDVLAFNVLAPWPLTQRLIGRARALCVDCLGKGWRWEAVAANDNRRMRPA